VVKLWVAAMFLVGTGFGIGLCVIWSWIRQYEAPPPSGEHDRL
jgi:hypothetical protein